MLHQIVCPGLPGRWINAWLAAVGTTKLDSRIRLSWALNGDAILHGDGIDPIDALVESWPQMSLLGSLPIAEKWCSTTPMTRKVTVDVFRERVKMNRAHPYSWTLSSTMTDLCVDKNGEVEHAPFDPAGPGTTKWLHHRLIKLQEHLDTIEAQVPRSLMGDNIRVKHNGLGFDQTRLGASSDNSDIWTDPVIETLAFFGLSMFPVRGDGTDQMLDPKFKSQKRQRGWKKISPRNSRHFHWPAWNPPLDFFAIDALLDVWNPDRKKTWTQIEIHTGWRSVTYSPRGSADTTRAFGSERL